MTTTDLQEAFTAYVPARWTEETWETCVPMKPFKNWLRVSVTKVDKHAIGRGVSDQIELTLDAPSQILKIQAGNTRAEFKCINAQEFPVCKESK